MRQTSIKAYYELQIAGHIKNRKKRIIQTLNILKYPISAFELAKYMGYNDRNSVHPRLNELVRSGVVKIVGKDKCSVTKKTVMLYAI